MTEPWRNRIVGSGEADPASLTANPANWRVHPRNQRKALASALDDIGFVQQVVVNTRTPVCRRDRAALGTLHGQTG